MLPENLKIEHSNRITVTVLDKDGNGVKNISVTVKENIPEATETETENKVEAKIAVGVTDKDGKVIVPPASEGITDKDGKTDISETIPARTQTVTARKIPKKQKPFITFLLRIPKEKLKMRISKSKTAKSPLRFPIRIRSQLQIRQL